MLLSILNRKLYRQKFIVTNRGEYTMNVDAENVASNIELLTNLETRNAPDTSSECDSQRDKAREITG